MLYLILNTFCGLSSLMEIITDVFVSVNGLSNVLFFCLIVTVDLDSFVVDSLHRLLSVFRIQGQLSTRQN